MASPADLASTQSLRCLMTLVSRVYASLIGSEHRRWIDSSALALHLSRPLSHLAPSKCDFNQPTERAFGLEENREAACRRSGETGPRVRISGVDSRCTSVIPQRSSVHLYREQVNTYQRNAVCCSQGCLWLDCLESHVVGLARCEPCIDSISTIDVSAMIPAGAEPECITLSALATDGGFLAVCTCSTHQSFTNLLHEAIDAVPVCSFCSVNATSCAAAGCTTQSHGETARCTREIVLLGGV